MDKEAGAGVRLAAAVISPDLAPHERAQWVQLLAHLVQRGAYVVTPEQLALALLQWAPRYGSATSTAERAGRRRAYMREYMRRRRSRQRLEAS